MLFILHKLSDNAERKRSVTNNEGAAYVLPSSKREARILVKLYTLRGARRGGGTHLKARLIGGKLTTRRRESMKAWRGGVKETRSR